MHASKTLLAFLMGLSILAPSAAWSEPLTGEQVIEKIRTNPTPKSSAVKLKMILVDERGGKNDKKERSAVILAKDTSEGGASRLRFESPADIKGVGLLVLARDKGTSDQWLYMPALKKTTRIAGAQKKGSFMGTDFTFEDLEPRDSSTGTHQLLREESLAGQNVWVVESKAKDPASSSYGRVVQWVRKDIAMPVQVEFYDKSDKLQKVLTTEGIEKIGAYWTARRTTMRDLIKKHSTVMEILEQKNDIEIPDTEFTERALSAN